MLSNNTGTRSVPINHKLFSCYTEYLQKQSEAATQEARHFLELAQTNPNEDYNRTVELFITKANAYNDALRELNAQVGLMLESFDYASQTNTEVQSENKRASQSNLTY